MFFDLAVERLCYTVTHVSTFVYHAYSKIAGRKLHIWQYILHISTQCLADAPCLRIASSWIVRCIPVENFGDRADTAIVGQMMTHRPEQGKQLFGAFQRMVVLRKRTENRRAEIPMPYPGGKLHHALAGNHSKCRDSPHGHW